MGTNEVRKRFGLGPAIPYGVCRLLQRFMLLDITHVMIKDVTEIDADTSTSPTECRFLDADEVRYFAQDRTNDLDGALAERIDLGYDFCFAGLVDDRLAGYCWLALDSIEQQHNRSGELIESGIAFSYPADHAFRYKGFTHPDFRGRRIYQQIGTQASIAMRQHGVRYVISTAEAINYSALRSSYRCGFEKLGTCTLFGFGGRRFVFAPNLRKRKIFLDKEATVLHRSTLMQPSDTTRIDPAWAS